MYKKLYFDTKEADSGGQITTLKLAFRIQKNRAGENLSYFFSFVEGFFNLV